MKFFHIDCSTALSIFVLHYNDQGGEEERGEWELEVSHNGYFFFLGILNI